MSTQETATHHTVTDHGAPGEVRILPVRGLPEFRPGDDLVAALARAAPWLADGDVVVVTSKVVSKVEGRLVTVPADPVARGSGAPQPYRNRSSACTCPPR